MVNGEAEEFGGDRVSFDMIKIKKGEVETRKSKVRALMVLQSHPPPRQRRCHERGDGRDRGWWFGGNHERKDGRREGIEIACLPP